MSTMVGSTPVARPRVREQARQVAAVMAFSAATSVGLSLTIVLLMSLGRA